MLSLKKKATRPTGRLGESLAAEFLVKQRYAIVETNYRKPYGEVDIIARDGGTVVFVEVNAHPWASHGVRGGGQPQAAADFPDRPGILAKPRLARSARQLRRDRSPVGWRQPDHSH